MEYTTITLPSGITAKLKQWITARDARRIRSFFLNDIEMRTDADGKPVTSGLKGSAVDEAENAALAAVIVELAGSGENIVDRALDLRTDDFQFLMAAVNEVTSNKRFLSK